MTNGDDDDGDDDDDDDDDDILYGLACFNLGMAQDASDLVPLPWYG